MSKKSKISVLMVPFAKKNPCHELLSRALVEQGVTLCKINNLRQIATTQWLNCISKIQIVNFTWTNQFFINKSRLITYIRAGLFILIVLLIKAMRKKIVWTVYNKYNHEQTHLDIDIATNKWLAKMCDAIKVECKMAKKIISQQYDLDKSCIHIIPEGHYLDSYPIKHSIDFSKKHFNLKNNYKTLLFVGSLREYKGLEDMLSIFSKISDRNVRFIIAGQPINESHKKSLLSIVAGDKRVIFEPKYIHPNNISLYMQAADAVVLPFKDILSSGSLIMSMGFAKPVIAPQIGCIGEILTPQGGFLYKPGALRKALRIFLSTSKVKLKKMGKYNKQQVKKLSWVNTATQMKKLYLDVLS